MDHFIAIDEEGYFLLPNQIRLNDQEAGYNLLKHLQFKDDSYHSLQSKYGEATVYVEAFDKPLVAEQVLYTDGEWQLLFPYGWKEKFEFTRLCLDEWDRFHGLTERDLPFVFSRKAQAEFFNLLDDYDDDSITKGSETHNLPPFYIENQEAYTDLFWKNIYQTNPSPNWDLGGPHPALADILPQVKILKCRIANLGCGRGHDAAFLADKGHVVTGIDISPEAIEYAKEHYGNIRHLNYHVGDLFQYNDNRFDLCFEHTAFCAIPPHRRKEMIKSWLRLLEPGGHFLGIFFVTPQRTGPPYGCSEWELRTLLEKKFRLLYWKRWQHSPGKRQGTELVIYAQKKD